jgi:hypothetical protein
VIRPLICWETFSFSTSESSSKCEALISNPSAAKKKKKKE